ncbi:DnaJ family molecular chaperone [Thermodesulfobacteriota bacterium]
MIVAEQELYRSCKILFGLETDFSREFLEYLQLSGIKSAYRQRARETHPDMAAPHGELAQRVNTVRFNLVQEAYDNLRHYLSARDNGFRFQTLYRPVRAHRGPRSARTRPSAATGNTGKGSARTSWTRKRNFTAFHTGRQHRKAAAHEALYTGTMPKRPLLLGHYLYYSGLISFRTIIQALVWQRTKRPRIGELGVRLGWLSNDDIQSILQHRTFNRPFGKSAVDLGMLTRAQLKALLYHQKCLQKKIGEFFLEHNILTPSQLNHLIQKHRRHNARLATSSRSGYTF